MPPLLLLAALLSSNVVWWQTQQCDCVIFHHLAAKVADLQTSVKADSDEQLATLPLVQVMNYPNSFVRSTTAENSAAMSANKIHAFPIPGFVEIGKAGVSGNSAKPVIESQ